MHVSYERRPDNAGRLKYNSITIKCALYSYYTPVTDSLWRSCFFFQETCRWIIVTATKMESSPMKIMSLAWVRGERVFEKFAEFSKSYTIDFLFCLVHTNVHGQCDKSNENFGWPISLEHEPCHVAAGQQSFRNIRRVSSFLISSTLNHLPYFITIRKKVFSKIYFNWFRVVGRMT